MALHAPCGDQEALVLEHCRLARHLARRYIRTPEQREDLEQVAYLGLVKAANRFDPDREVAFTAFAVPTILGELRRFCRDTRWAAHVPRAVQERVQALRRVEDDHQNQHGRAPNVAEAARALGWSEEDVLDARVAAGSLRPESLNASVRGPDGAIGEAIDTIGSEDNGFRAAEQRDELEHAIGHLTGPQRRALQLRIEVGCSTPEIARQMGISRSQASRLVVHATAKVRTALQDEAPLPERRSPQRFATPRPERPHRRPTPAAGGRRGPNADGSRGWLLLEGALPRTA